MKGDQGRGEYVIEYRLQENKAMCIPPEWREGWRVWIVWKRYRKKRDRDQALLNLMRKDRIYEYRIPEEEHAQRLEHRTEDE